MEENESKEHLKSLVLKLLSWSYKGYTWRSEIGLWLEDER
jgi:hypothetical protein